MTFMFFPTKAQQLIGLPKRHHASLIEHCIDFIATTIPLLQSDGQQQTDKMAPV